MTLPTDPRAEQSGIPQQAGVAPTGFITTDAPTPVRRRPRWPWIAAAVAVLLAVAAGITYLALPGDDDEAVDRCQSAVSAQLKAPATAQYGERSVTSEQGDFGTYYEVTGVLDAQNGFGALVRGDYRCKVTRESDGSWLVTESTFTQR